MTFNRYMTLQVRAMRASGIPALLWVDKCAARFRRNCERRGLI